MRLVHFSKNPALRFEDIEVAEERTDRLITIPPEQRTEKDRVAYVALSGLRGPIGSKPRGALWVSDEDAKLSWSKFCNQFQETIDKDSKWWMLESNAYCIELVNSPRVLYLTDWWKIRRFVDSYGEYQDDHFWEDSRLINWVAVTEDFDAVIISPYCWGVRQSNWYYSWDCASGPILHPRAIKRWELLGEWFTSKVAV